MYVIFIFLHVHEEASTPNTKTIFVSINLQALVVIWGRYRFACPATRACCWAGPAHAATGGRVSGSCLGGVGELTIAPNVLRQSWVGKSESESELVSELVSVSVSELGSGSALE